LHGLKLMYIDPYAGPFEARYEIPPPEEPGP
jgi:hypothetical protein